MGKFSFMVIAAIAFAAGIFGNVVNRNSSTATLTYTSYYSQTAARNANNSALQLALRKLADSTGWRSGYSSLVVQGTTIQLRVDTVTYKGVPSIKLTVKSPYYSDTSNGRMDTLKSTVIVQTKITPPGIHAAITAFGPLDHTISDMYIDGRDHDSTIISSSPLPAKYTLLPNKGYYGISTGAPTFDDTQTGYIGGTDRTVSPYLDILPAYPENPKTVETNAVWPNGFPKTPDAAMGWPDGTLEALAKTGSNGSRYITTQHQMDSLCTAHKPLTGITYVDVAPTDTFWSHKNLPDGSGGILIFHCKTKTANWVDISGVTTNPAMTFKGLMIFDRVFHFHMNCLGALIILTPNTETSANCNGNADKTIAFSSLIVQKYTGMFTAKLQGGWRSALTIVSWKE